MFGRIFDRNKLEVSIIACGRTGQEIGGEMIEALKKHGAKIKSLAVSSEIEKHRRSDLFTTKVSIKSGTKDGFAKNLEIGKSSAKLKREELSKGLQKIIPEEKEGLMLIITGAGATGLGSTMEIVDILYNEYKKIPPILTLLPETFESSRVQYNVSIFLYEMAFKPESKGNAILLLDNKPSLSELSKPLVEVASKRVETIPNAFADLLFSSFEDSVTEEFDAKTNDLFDVMHTTGISVFIAETLSGQKEGDVDNSRINDVIASSIIATTNLSTDQIFDAKNAFITLFNIDRDEESLSFQSEFEARKLSRSFQETLPHIKFVESDENEFGTEAKLRGIVSGLPLPNRILQIMRLARKSKKRVMIQESTLANQVVPLGIEKVERLENKLKNLDSELF